MSEVTSHLRAVLFDGETGEPIAFVPRPTRVRHPILEILVMTRIPFYAPDERRPTEPVVESLTFGIIELGGLILLRATGTPKVMRTLAVAYAPEPTHQPRSAREADYLREWRAAQGLKATLERALTA